jgi:hypothetical protein
VIPHVGSGDAASFWVLSRLPSYSEKNRGGEKLKGSEVEKINKGENKRKNLKPFSSRATLETNTSQNQCY